MARRPHGTGQRARSALGALALLVSFAGTAHAKPWAKWAPAPLESDSSYAALAAKPADSLDAGELAWVEVQHEWRQERDLEAGRGIPRSSITEGWNPHHARPNDGRFAALASRPFASLTDRELVWLVSENAARRSAEGASKQTALGLIALLALGLSVLSLIALYGAYRTGWLFP